MSAPMILAMLARQGIEGDDALLRLARERFREAGVGAELYPNDPEDFREILKFKPANLPCTVHLPRYLDLTNAATLDEIMKYAQIGSNRIHGMILHDNEAFASAPYDVTAAMREADKRLYSVDGRGMLFVEYAHGNTPEQFAAQFEENRDLAYVSACIDVSHVGIRACQVAFAKMFPGKDVCALKTTSPELPEYMTHVERAMAEGRAVTMQLISRLAALQKPLHFHLHDGHPSSTLSKYGVSDHLSFMQTLRVPFRVNGLQTLTGIYGLSGLRELVEHTLSLLPPEKVSFTIEVHPQEGRKPLGDHAGIFDNWKDKTNAERMNYYVEILLRNAMLVRDAAGG
jgi:hypothetical protein